MKIQDIINQRAGIQGRVDNDEKKSTEPKESMFDSHLRRLDNENYEQRLASALEQINKQGEKLSKFVDIKELKRYKKLIADFLYDAVNNSHKFSKENMLDRRGRHRTYAIITKVNEHVDELTKEVLKEEKDNIKILQKLDDIRGLLLDISM